MNMSMLVNFPWLAVRMMMVNFRCSNIVAVHPGDLEMPMVVAQVRAESSSMIKSELMLYIIVYFPPLPDRLVSVGVEIVVVESHAEVLLGWPEL